MLFAFSMTNWYKNLSYKFKVLFLTFDDFLLSSDSWIFLIDILDLDKIVEIKDFDIILTLLLDSFKLYLSLSTCSS